MLVLRRACATACQASPAQRTREASAPRARRGNSRPQMALQPVICALPTPSLPPRARSANPSARHAPPTPPLRRALAPASARRASRAMARALRANSAPRGRSKAPLATPSARRARRGSSARLARRALRLEHGADDVADGAVVGAARCRPQGRASARPARPIRYHAMHSSATATLATLATLVRLRLPSPAPRTTQSRPGWWTFSLRFCEIHENATLA